MKRFFLFFLALALFTGTAAAQDAEVFASGDYKYTILEDGTVCLKEYFGDAAELTIPAEIDGKPVTAIGDWAFSDCESLTAITIPDSVTVIEDCAFLNCDSLTAITIPDSVTVIRDWAFYGCDNLTAIIIPDSVTTIGERAFQDCENLMSITIPDSVRKVGANPFLCAPTAIWVSPEHPYLEVIDGVLFEKESKRLISYPYGSKQSKYAIPKGTRRIGAWAFHSCESLTSISIPDSVAFIEQRAFQYCSSLTAITIPDSVTSIGDGAFYGCRSLMVVTIPDSVTDMGDELFEECDHLALDSSTTSPTRERKECWTCGGDGNCNRCGGSGRVREWNGDRYVEVTCGGAFCSHGDCTDCGGRGYKNR